MKPGNWPVFPSSDDIDHGGMSFRQHAAVQIMAGFASNASLADTDKSVEDLVATVVRWTDALIAELAKSP